MGMTIREAALALLLMGSGAVAACGGRSEGGDDGVSDGTGALTPGVGSPQGQGGAGGEPPANIGNIGGAQFMVATRCDECGIRRDDERCLALVTAMPFVGDPAYYPCLDVSLQYASCIDAQAGCSDLESVCADESAALAACF
jgi:hypothetical protein